MKLSEVCSWRNQNKLYAALLIFVLLSYIRFDEIFWTKFYNVNKFSSYIFYYKELQDPSSILQHQYDKMINSTCPHVLNEEKLMHSNIYWQQMIQTNGKIMYLYSSYYDNRTRLKNNPVIRIITMFEKPNLLGHFYCYLWFEDEIYSTISKTTHIFRLNAMIFKDHDNPYIITCPVPFEIRHKIPTSVSLSKNKCSNITNSITVGNNQPEKSIKKDFAVCIKALDYADIDISYYMIEWFELLFLMGVDKVFAYEYAVHPNISKVLQHYINKGQLSVTPITLPGNAPNDPILRHQYLEETNPKRQYVNQIVNEKIPFNDCFYQNMNRYKYIAVMDLDEIILPRKFTTWKELIKNLTLNGQHSHASYRFKRTIILDSMREIHGWSDFVPKYMYMSQNIYRSPVYEKDPKSIFNTDHVISMGSHANHACLTRCKNFNVRPTDGHVFHYRHSCKAGKWKFCGPGHVKRSIRDEAVLRYRDHLVENTSQTLKNLGLL